jgi:hypothetical protein
MIRQRFFGDAPRWPVAVRGLLVIVIASVGGSIAAAQTITPAKVTAPVQANAHTSFATATEAVNALVAAVRRGDVARMRAIFGPGAEDLVEAGDPVADRAERQRLIRMYEARHKLVADGPDRKFLIVGSRDWQMPTPLLRIDGRWAFDGAAGVEELVYRRIGSNELGAIAVCNGIVDAEADYVAANPEKHSPPTYGKLLSDPGRRNGLYWQTKQGEPDSPLGPLVAEAAEAGYTSGAGAPYHGYYFRLVTAQGAAAAGGAKSYLVDGALTGGFAVVAWPAQYRASGVMTFIVNKDGVVYQKDLGDDTAKRAESLVAFDPDSTWVPVDKTP